MGIRKKKKNIFLISVSSESSKEDIDIIESYTPKDALLNFLKNTHRIPENYTITTTHQKAKARIKKLPNSYYYLV